MKRSNMVRLEDVVNLVTPEDAEGLGAPKGGRGMSRGASSRAMSPGSLRRPMIPAPFSPITRPQQPTFQRSGSQPHPRRPDATRHRPGHHRHRHRRWWGGYPYYPYYYPYLSELYVVEQQCVFEARVGNMLSGSYPVTQEGYNAALQRAREIAGQVMLRCGSEYYDPGVVLQTWSQGQ